MSDCLLILLRQGDEFCGELVILIDIIKGGQTLINMTRMVNLNIKVCVVGGKYPFVESGKDRLINLLCLKEHMEKNLNLYLAAVK